MKLPFHTIIGPLLKSQTVQSGGMCELDVFCYCTVYTFTLAVLGFVISGNNLKKHIGEEPLASDGDFKKFMFLHDLKIIALSISVLQYTCVLLGCLTENPVLFLPHLGGQLLIVGIKLFNSISVLFSSKKTAWREERYNIPSVLLMSFNWCQEFCVFSKCLCVCDL